LARSIRRALELLDGERRDGQRRRVVTARPQAVEQDRQHAPPDVRRHLARVERGRAQHELQQRQVGGAHVGAQRAVGLRTLDDPVGQRLDALARSGDAQVAVGRGEDDLMQAPVDGVHLGGVLHEVHEARPRVVLVEGLQRDGLDGRDAVLEERVDQLLLVREAAVDGAHADAGATGDLVQRDLQAVLGEALGGRREDALPVALGVAAQRAVGG
jgi:hypothetical protein